LPQSPQCNGLYLSLRLEVSSAPIINIGTPLIVTYTITNTSATSICVPAYIYDSLVGLINLNLINLGAYGTQGATFTYTTNYTPMQANTAQIPAMAAIIFNYNCCTYRSPINNYLINNGNVYLTATYANGSLTVSNLLLGGTTTTANNVTMTITAPTGYSIVYNNVTNPNNILQVQLGTIGANTALNAVPLSLLPTPSTPQAVTITFTTTNYNSAPNPITITV
jgi:hypothetical protein